MYGKQKLENNSEFLRDRLKTYVKHSIKQKKAIDLTMVSFTILLLEIN